MVGSTIQHYRIRDRLGAGGMGEVYLAEDTRLGREVALKFLPAEAQNDQERRARFLTEARAASALRSSNIAAIYDIGQHEGADYIVMEYVEGELLSHRIHRGPIPVREAVDIAVQIDDALVEAHARGIVHRDIKSANIIVTGRGQVKVLDFGLAKFLEPPSGQASLDVALTVGEDTLAGAVLGTVSYMAPEQALGRNVDQRSDLFSAGVVIYEMLTGRLPFEGRTFGEVVDAILHHIPTPVVRLNAAVPASLESLVRKALEKNADLRYQTARDMFNDLQRVKTELDEIERHGGQLRSSANHGQAAVQAPDNSIAVVTFTNITREPADEWIGSGIAETVSADLKNVQGLTVIGRERVFDALRNLEAPSSTGQDDRLAIELGRGLGARWIISGAYQRIGESIRITARFVEMATGAVLRNVKIDGRLSDIFGLQDRIVFELTQDLKLTLEPSAINQIQQPETRSVEAYELYSRGMLTLRMASRDAPDRAIHFFEKALATDRDYAEAWAGLGAAYQIKGVFVGLPELLEKALVSADEALAARSEACRRVRRPRQRAVRARPPGRSAALVRRSDRARPEERPRARAARARALGRPRRPSGRDRGARARRRDQPAVRIRASPAGVSLHGARRLRRGRTRGAQGRRPAGAVHLRRRGLPRRRRAHAPGVRVLPAGASTRTRSPNIRRSCSSSRRATTC